MPALTAQAFVQFFNDTRQSILTGPDNIINFAQRSNYPIMELIKGQDPFSLARGGQSILEVVAPTSQSTFESYNPGDQATPNIGGASKTLTFQWRFFRSNTGWTDAEYTLHTSGGEKQQVKSFNKTKQQKVLTDHVNGLDFLTFARPNSATMESAPAGVGGAQGTMFSVPAFISEDATRFRPPVGSWSVSTIAGMDVTTEPGWRNQVETFTAVDQANPTTGILSGFDRMELDIMFNPIPKASDVMQSSSPSDIGIYTNKDGYTSVQGICRGSQDRWTNPIDGAFSRPKFDNMPLVYVPQLDTELLEQTTGGSAAYSGAAYTVGRPRFFWLNKTTIKPVFNGGDMFKQMDAIRGGISYPDTTVVYMNTLGNLVCNNRRFNGIVAPV